MRRHGGALRPVADGARPLRCDVRYQEDQGGPFSPFDCRSSSAFAGFMAAPPEPDPEQTADLLQRWHAGERGALDVLVERNLSWIEAFVRRRLGPRLRGKEETVDLVQDAIIDVLTYGPRFVVPDRNRFRALLGRIVENNLRDKNAYYRAMRRDVEREEALPTRSVVHLDGTPSQAVARDEHLEMTQLALELLAPEDREVLVLREREQLSFDEVARRIGVSKTGARKRYRRALVRAADKVLALRKGSIDDALGGDAE